MDTVDIDSSSHGKSVLSQMGNLQNLQREMGGLADSGSSHHGETLQQLKSALHAASAEGVPRDVRETISRALQSAEGGGTSVYGTGSSVRSAGVAAQDIEYGANEVARDTLPGEWEIGADVSAYADSTARAIDQTRDNLGRASYEAGAAAGTHRTVGSETERALNTVNAHLGQPEVERPSASSGEVSTPESSAGAEGNLDGSGGAVTDSEALTPSVPVYQPTPQQMLLAQKIIMPSFQNLQRMAWQTGIPVPPQFAQTVNPWGQAPAAIPRLGPWSQPFPPMQQGTGFPNPRPYWNGNY